MVASNTVLDQILNVPRMDCLSLHRGPNCSQRGFRRYPFGVAGNPTRHRRRGRRFRCLRVVCFAPLDRSARFRGYPVTGVGSRSDPEARASAGADAARPITMEVHRVFDRTQAVVFDVDGTLVDSNYFHVIAWQRAFWRDDRSVAAADIHRLIGMGADQMLPVLIGAPGPQLEDLWHEEFLAMRDEVQPTEGAADLVRAVSELGASVVYATSGKAEDVRVLRAVIGADRWVDEVVSSNDVEHSKPAPDIFELALRRCGGDPGRTMVIGDTTWDVRAATAARLPCIGLTCGGITAHELTAAGAVAVFDTPAHLLEQLSVSPIGRLLAS